MSDTKKYRVDIEVKGSIDDTTSFRESVEDTLFMHDSVKDPDSTKVSVSENKGCAFLAFAMLTALGSGVVCCFALLFVAIDQLI